MKTSKAFLHKLLNLALAASFCIGLFAPQAGEADARPMRAADAVSVVISEFRTRGSGGADDEFIEIYNATGAPVSLLDWELRKSSGCGATITNLVTITSPLTLAPGQYYLFGKSPEFLGAPDLTYTSSIADDGGIALVDASGTLEVVVDEVGMCSTTEYKEGTTLSALSGTANQSYERKYGGSAGNCRDTDNNAADFVLNSSSSNPQNSSSAPLLCLVVTNVSSTDGTYTATQTVDITVRFSNNVNVSGSPTLLLETGLTDRNATYLSGSGTNSLVFRYTVVAGDTASDLDYVSANALTLNGGSITGAIGDATLVLPKPGQPGSLGAGSNVVIDNGVGPSVLSFRRQTPNTASTNADSLTFLLTFSEGVTGVDAGDFVVNSTVAGPLTVGVSGSGAVYQVTISDGDLDDFNGTVGLNMSTAPVIQDITGNSLPPGEPPIDELYTVDNTPPGVTINQAASQTDPAGVLPVNFALVFSEAIDAATFTTADITHTGTAGFVTWSIADPGDHINFTLSAIAAGNGTLIPSIAAGVVKDPAGNNNTASTSTDNNVTLNDVTPPTVTINQASTQSDPTGTLPVRFTALFSEPINPGLFTASDITQNGTATGVTWGIANSGDNRTFTVSATAGGFGTLVPSIGPNRVTDWAGNNNPASTSTDNSVNYVVNTANVRSVIINEVAWAGTTSSLTSDEWIELYNPGSTAINVTGWTLRAADNTPSITLNGMVSPGGYFLLERDDDNTVSDILADQVYTGELSNGGEALTLRDGSNKVIDTANGNGGGWPAGSASTYGTMERSRTSSETDSLWSTNAGLKKNGKNANNGDILGTPKSSNSISPTPTPTNVRRATPVAPLVGRPIINEFLARPGFDWNQDGDVNVFDEFIEIKNIGTADISLNGWQLDDEAGRGSNPFTLSDVTLEPGQRVVYYGLEMNILLSDGGDTVRLLDQSGKIFDSYTYDIARAEDRSVCRLPDGYGSWYEDCVPTPNLTNNREGQVPSMTGGDDFESPVCGLPDTLPADFLFAECRGYGAGIWRSMYWDAPGWGAGDRFVRENTSKWESFVE